MAVLDTYANSVTQSSSGYFVSWNSPTSCLGNNLLLTNSAFTNSITFTTYITDHLRTKYSASSINSFFASNGNPDPTSVTVKIKYKITSSSSPSVAGTMALTIGGTSGAISLTPVVTNKSNVYDLQKDSGIKTAIFVFNSSTGVPTLANLIDTGFYTDATVSVSNATGDLTVVRIYEYLLEIDVTPISGPLVNLVYTSNGQQIQSGVSVGLGSIIIPNNIELDVSIKNVGDSILTVSGITHDSVATLQDVPSIPFTIGAVSTPIKAIFSVNSVGNFTNTITIQSNSISNPNFNLIVSFSGASSSELSPPLISPYYGPLALENNKTISISAQPLDIINIINIDCKNLGQTNLLISSVSVSGDASISAANKLVNGSLISYNSSIQLSLSLNSSSYGNKSINIVISSNDPVRNPFTFNITYNVLPQFEASLFSGGVSLIDGTSLDIGSLDKGKSFIKTYSIKNTGIYSTLIINSISLIDKLSFASNISYPVILSPNGANSLVFSLQFDTSSVGLKDGSLTINYAQGT